MCSRSRWGYCFLWSLSSSFCLAPAWVAVEQCFCHVSRKVWREKNEKRAQDRCCFSLVGLLVVHGAMAVQKLCLRSSTQWGPAFSQISVELDWLRDVFASVCGCWTHWQGSRILAVCLFGVFTYKGFCLQVHRSSSATQLPRLPRWKHYDSEDFHGLWSIRPQAKYSQVVYQYL